MLNIEYSNFSMPVPSEIKTLIIIRHSKSSWRYSDINDLDRPLKKSGILRTQKIAEGLKKRYIFPQFILSSHANRAMHTSSIICRDLQLGFDKINFEENFYFSEKQNIKEVVFKCSDEINTLMIVGHNPIWTELVNDWQQKSIDPLPTSGVAIIEFQTPSWKEINAKYSKLNYLGRF